jgi:hypothetical protein
MRVLDVLINVVVDFQGTNETIHPQDFRLKLVVLRGELEVTYDAATLL